MPDQPTAPVAGFPEANAWLQLTTEAQRYERLKLYYGNSKSASYTLAKAYERSVRVTQFLKGFRTALLALENKLQLKKDEKWAKGVLVACRALDEGLLTYWNSVKVEADGLLKDGKYPSAKTTFQSSLGDVVANVSFPEGQAGDQDKIPGPLSVPGPDESTDHEVSEVVFSIIAFACNANPNLSKVAPLLGISPSQVMEMVHAIGWNVFLQYQKEYMHVSGRIDHVESPITDHGSSDTGHTTEGRKRPGANL